MQRDNIALGAILLAAAVLRFWDLGGPSFWVDELYSWNFAQVPQGRLWSDWMAREPVPPLFYSLLRGWTGLFGDGEVAQRALSAMLGVLAVAAIFLVARALVSTNVALLAAALAAVNSQQLEFSQQVRGYTLGVLAAAFAILALIRLTDRWRTPGNAQPWAPLLLYVGASTAAFYTHTTFFLLPLLANLYIGWLWAFRTPRHRDTALAWIGANFLLAVLCAWWVWMTYLQMASGAGMISWIERPDLQMGVLKLAHIIAPRELPLKWVLVALFGGLFLLGAWRLTVERRVLAFVFGAGVPFILFVISQKQPIYMERTLFWPQVIYLPCIAAGILGLPIRRLRASIGAVSVALFLADAVVWRQSEYREPWREVAAVIAARAGENDAVLTYSRDATVNLAYYCRQTRCKDVSQLAVASLDGANVLHFAFKGQQVDPLTLSREISRFDRIWVVSRGRNDDPRRYLAGAAILEADDLLITDPIADISEAPPRNDMTLSVWRPHLGAGQKAMPNPLKET